MTTTATTILLAVLGLVTGALWVAFALLALLAYILGASTGPGPIDFWQPLLAVVLTGLVPLGLFVAAAVSAFVRPRQG